ncbi:MAG TPA: RNA methyltransferase, partial [Ktedonobacteraceae bacterium]|nr:RNA methyltransferase [Ktedonobacteraceae bacterium]
MIQITSPSNPRISRLRELHTTRGRKKSGLFLMEGPHLLQTLLEASLLPQEVYYEPDLLRRSDEGKELLIRLRELIPEQMIEVSERVIEALGEAQTSQGVVSVLPYTLFEPNKLRRNRPAAKRSCLLVLDDLADPGNMGAILRTALAADVESILLTPHCVDCFSPKVVRSAAGAHVALPIESDMSWEQIESRIEKHC